MAQVSRDLYLLYRVHRRRRTQEFHFLSLVYVAGKSMAYVHPCNTKMGGRAVKLSRKDVKELGKGEQDGGGVEKQQRGPKHRPHGSINSGSPASQCL